MPGASNRPSLNGQAVNLVDHLAEIVAGFTRNYRLIMRHRDPLLSPNGPLARFAEDEVRVIVRPTRTYAVLLDECREHSAVDLENLVRRSDLVGALRANRIAVVSRDGASSL